MQIVFYLCAERSGLHAKFCKIKYRQLEYSFLKLISEFTKLIVLSVLKTQSIHLNMWIKLFVFVQMSVRFVIFKEGMWETAHVLDALITGIHGQVTLLLLPWKPPGTRTRVPYCTIPIELSPENFLRLFFFRKHWFYTQRGRGRRRNILWFHLFMHSVIASCMCPDQGSNLQPWHIRTIF